MDGGRGYRSAAGEDGCFESELLGAKALNHRVGWVRWDDYAGEAEEAGDAVFSLAVGLGGGSSAGTAAASCGRRTRRRARVPQAGKLRGTV